MNRLHDGARGDGAELADLKIDIDDPTLGLLGGILVGNGPSREPARVAENVALGDAVTLIVCVCVAAHVPEPTV